MSARKLYRYEVRREDRWWLITVPDLGLVTQARQLRDTDRMARSIIALHRNVDPDSFEVIRDQVIGMPARMAGLVTEAAEGRLRQERLAEDLAAATKEAALALIDDGVTLRDAGYLLGLSHQRIAQIVAETSASTPKRRRESRSAASARG